MTCIATDGRSMAADKQSTFSGLRVTTTKIQRLRDGRLVGCAGNSSICRALVLWINGDADPEKYPDKKAECSMLVLGVDGAITLHDDGPTPIQIEDRFAAIGSGRDFAIAAMHLGHSAAAGVQIACKYEAGCGQGIDVLELE